MSEVELRDWEHFKEFVAVGFGGGVGFAFRGHSDRSWKLESTLTRLGKKVSEDLTADFLERTQLKNFQMKIRGLRGANPSPLSDNELWALGQHYGLSTPLLDWTESPYIAAYFAFENAESCNSEWRTIFALNRVGLMSKLSKEQDHSSDRIEFIEPLLDDNKRLITQAGLFTKTPTNVDLETWLKEKGLDAYLTKINIENCYRNEVLNDLRLMNIVGSSIYPDLHGASVFCNMWIENFNANREGWKTVQCLFSSD